MVETGGATLNTVFLLLQSVSTEKRLPNCIMLAWLGFHRIKRRIPSCSGGLPAYRDPILNVDERRRRCFNGICEIKSHLNTRYAWSENPCASHEHMTSLRNTPRITWTHVRRAETPHASHEHTRVAKSPSMHPMNICTPFKHPVRITWTPVCHLHIPYKPSLGLTSSAVPRLQTDLAWLATQQWQRLGLLYHALYLTPDPDGCAFYWSASLTVAFI